MNIKSPQSVLLSNENMSIKTAYNSILKFFNGLLFTAKLFSGEFDQAAKNRVAAGNPSHNLRSTAISDKVPEIVAEQTRADETVFMVEGNSLRPLGIKNGDALICKRLSSPAPSELPLHSFIIIDVDKEYYQHFGKVAHFDYKLRHSISPIEKNIKPEELIEFLKETEDSVLLEENRRLINEKYKEAREFYGDDRVLVISETFKEGKQCYSFHPLNLVTFVALRQFRQNEDHKWYEIPLNSKVE